MNDVVANRNERRSMASATRENLDPWANATPTNTHFPSSSATSGAFYDLGSPPETTGNRASSLGAGGATANVTSTMATSMVSPMTPTAPMGMHTSASTSSSNLRTRTVHRRLQSDVADFTDNANAEISSQSSPYMSPPTLERDNFFSTNVSTSSLNSRLARERSADRRRSRKDSDTLSSTASGTRSLRIGMESGSSERLPLPGPTLSSTGGDWDDNDKTRESKARKAAVQGKGKKQNGLPSPFPFGLGSGFGSKLWQDVGTLWNETISPSYDKYHDPAVSGGRGGHVYLDVWGKPIARAPEGVDDPFRVSAALAGSRNGRSSEDTRGMRGPLVEREEFSASTTPSLSRKTSISHHSPQRPSILGEGLFGLNRSTSPISSRSKSRETAKEKEAEVFEHIIQPSDSLAGVALKYGVTVAQLRKCNKMWANDTIHLRKVLYIPVDSARTAPSSNLSGSNELVELTSPPSSPRRAESYTSKPQLRVDIQPPTDISAFYAISPASSVTPSASSNPIPGSATTSSSKSVISGGQSNSGSESRSISSAPSTRRIPISELSYFPPPSTASTTIFTSNPHPSVLSASASQRWETENGSISSSPGRNLPSSIMNVLSSLNDNIASRVSFETVRSVRSNSAPGSGNVSGEDDVELDEMGKVVPSIKPKLGASSDNERNRIRVKPRTAPPLQSTFNTEVERGRSGGKRVITKQLPPRTMELPLMNSSPRDSARP